MNTNLKLNLQETRKASIQSRAYAHAYAREIFFVTTSDKVCLMNQERRNIAMKTSKTVVYAFACIQELSKKMGEFVQVSEIALAQNIPSAYCQKVLFALAKAGIVSSVKGQGFTLAIATESISTLSILRALSDNGVEASEMQSGRNLGDALTSKVNEVLSRMSVAEILFATR